MFDPAYPAGLHDLHDPPLAVFLRGALAPAAIPADGAAVAIVGARNAKQAEGVMRAGELKLTAEEIAEIEGAAAAATAR